MKEVFLLVFFLYKIYFLKYEKCWKIRCLDIIKKTWERAQERNQDLPKKEKEKKWKYCYRHYRNLPEKKNKRSENMVKNDL